MSIYTNYALQKIHGLDYYNLIKEYELVKTNEIEQFSNLDLTKSGLAFGISHYDFEDKLNKENTVIIGGPCICYSQANIKKITVQDVADIVNPISVAAGLGCDVVIFFQTHEALLQQNEIDNFTSTVEEWEDLYKDLFKLTMHIASLFNLKKEQIQIISTSNERTKNVMDKILLMKEADEILTPEYLYGMYSVDGKSNHPRGDKAEQLFLNIYKRNIVTYLPLMIKEDIGKEYTNALVIENCTQLKTSYKANELNKHLLNSDKNSILHLGYISVPGLDGREMYRSYPRKRIYLDTEEEKIRKMIKGADELLYEYYQSLWPEEITNSALSGVDRFIDGYNNIRKVIFDNHE